MGSNDRNIVDGVGTDRTFNRAKILVVLLLFLAMSLMAVSSINVALPSIQHGLQAHDSDLQWVLSGYALTFGITLVPAGRMGDLLGRGNLFVAGVAVFSVASLVCGLAHSADILNLARLAQGVGAGLAGPQTTGMVTQYFSGQGRAKAFSYFGLVLSVSVAIGPLTTGIIIQALGDDGWRFSFLVNFPLGLLCMVLALLWFPFNAERQRWLIRKSGGHTRLIIDLDPVGATMLCLAVLCIMLPFMIKTGPGFALLILGAALLFGWVRWESGYQSRGQEPMVDLGLFKHRNFSTQTAISSINFLGGTSIFALLAIWLQNGLHVPALAVGMIGLPNALCSATLALIAGKRALTRGRIMVAAAMGSIVVGVLACIGTASLIERFGISFWWLMLPLSLIGIGQGSMGSANQTLSMADIPAAAGGTAGGIKQTGERIATAVGNAMLTAIMFSLLVRHGWTVGYQAAYAAIVVIAIVALTLALRDLMQHGPGIIKDFTIPASELD